jgi:arylsulfatase A
MDAAFGSLMKALNDLQLEDNTFVFFTSDNGPEGDGVKSPGRGSTGGLRGRKRDLYEGGIRVPGLARWPGKIPAQSTVSAPVIGSDLLPTVLALTGTDPAPLGSRTLDGVNVLPLLQASAPSVPRPQPLFWRLDMAPKPKIALRVGNLKLLANPTTSEFELYDLAQDPQETRDLKDQRPEDFLQLKTQLLSQNSAIEADGPDWWKRLSPSGASVPGAKPAKKQGH